MAKQNVAEQETLGEAMNKTELFFERNGRTMSYVFLGLLVLAALVFGYRSLILQPRATKAAEMLAEAQTRQYLAAMRALGCGKQEIHNLFDQMEEQEHADL